MLAVATPTYDFFEAQRRLRRRSWLLMGGLFMLLWLLVNALLIAMHSSQECNTQSDCETTYHLNVAGALVSALGVGAYLVGAAFLTSRVMVAGSAGHAAHGPDTAMLRNVAEEVAIASGVAPPQVFVLDDPALNAYAVGDGRRHGAVVVTTGLLTHLNRRELAGVLAHEIAHIRNRDSCVLLVAIYAGGAVVVVAAILTAVAALASHAMRGAGNNLLGLLLAMLALSIVVVAAAVRLVAVPAILLIRAALVSTRGGTRRRVRGAVHRDPGGLRRALEKIASAPSRPHVGSVARALCIEQAPDLETRTPLISNWMGSHPSIAQRIAWLRSLEAALGA